MSFEIEGKTGNKLDVTSRGFARTLSTSVPIQFDASLYFQRAWTYSATVTPTGAGDYFFYLKNSTARDMVITRVSIVAASTETVTLVNSTGTAAGGTVISPANRTVGSNRLPSPGMEVQGGVDITGLSPNGNLEALALATAIRTSVIELTLRPIIVRPNYAIAMNATTGAIALTWYVDVMEQVIDPVAVI